MINRRTQPEKSPLQNQIEMFMLDCKSRRLTKQTVEFYTQKIGRFAKWCDENALRDARQIRPVHLRTFMASLDNYSANYQHNLARATKRFLTFCVEEKIIESSPYEKLKMPRLPKHAIASFAPDEIKRMIMYAACQRDRAMIYFLLDTGVRLSEMCSLLVGDVDLDKGEVRVRMGKGQKDRTVYIGAKTRKEVFKYLSTRTPAPRQDRPLWISLKNRRAGLTTDALVQMMQRLREDTGIADLTCHTFRRTFAINCLRNGMSIYMLAKLMGHTDISMLIKYLKIVEDDLADAHRQHGVVDNL